MQNPITELRESLNYSRRNFALVLGISVPTLDNAERGFSRNPYRVFEALAAAGFDRAGIEREYARWREAEMEALRALHQLALEQRRQMRRDGE